MSKRKSSGLVAIALLIAWLGFTAPAFAAGAWSEVRPSSGPAGALVTGRGGGYPPNSTVFVLWDNTPAPLGDTSTDGNGDFSITFNVPGDATAGLHPVYFVGSPDRSSAAFTVTTSGGGQAPTCQPAYFLALRGSGEPAGKLGELQPYYDEIAKLYGSDRIRYTSVAYPAIDIIAPFNKVSAEASAFQQAFESGDFKTAGQRLIATVELTRDTVRRMEESARQGGAEMIKSLGIRTQACPEQRIVLAGYSQGAWALHEAMKTLDSAYYPKIAFTIFDGDPWFNFQGVKGVADGLGFLFGLQAPVPYIPTTLEWVSWCNGTDPICNLPPSIPELIRSAASCAAAPDVIGCIGLADAQSALNDLQTWRSWVDPCAKNDTSKCGHFMYEFQAERTALGVVKLLP